MADLSKIQFYIGFALSTTSQSWDLLGTEKVSIEYCIFFFFSQSDIISAQFLPIGISKRLYKV